ncbi:glycosyl hydrolase 115 family protein [uncultured Mucilaginibacter sp.]|uniref:glycosyl hydrolase 115 family protein n=1 Tax=uncultured Mucilaginibacter sp. TaxID=797541 RepID=UPI0025DC4743|nr:glycosyl hydrolase 115 family protein [uncultured Mucilaginibacter sp.]
MSVYRKIFAIALACFIGHYAIAQSNTDKIAVTTSGTAKAFPLVKGKNAAAIWIDPADAEVVSIAANCFSNDIKSVTGVAPAVVKTGMPAQYAVIAGTIGHSKMIDAMIANGQIDVSKVKGQWETFSISVVNAPTAIIKQALVITGSDRRGTAFGLFELSRMIGVSPLVWWADVTPQHKDELYITPGASVVGPPSVKFRGIFINDEDWGMQPWAAKNMDKDIKDIGPNTYAHIFEMLLRMKANYIWPAMHPCTKAFWYYKENPVVADRYAIVLGASHCEPILRDNVFEWADNYQNEYGKAPGEWRYDLNKDQIGAYWQTRATEAAKIDAVYTVGMRGIHDGSMPGPKSKPEKVKLLENIITDQRDMLSKTDHKAADDIPQIFCPYKEVLDLYQAGMKLPDDITICWADDNHGYIRQVSNPEEQKRSGGSGVYYHLSYWGAPHDYLWLESTSPSLISYEMSKAYQFSANKVWIFNVGDLKPAEQEIQFSMDLAWDINKWTPEKAHEYPKVWAAETFGQQFARPIADIKDRYYKLAASAKPEHVDVVAFTDKEIDQRLADYHKLAADAEELGKKIPANLQDAYYELILYPVKGACLMNDKIFYAQRTFTFADPENGKKAKAAFDEIKLLTKKYNEVIAGGKWNGMMSDHPRDQKVFNMPALGTDRHIGRQKTCFRA